MNLQDLAHINRVESREYVASVFSKARLLTEREVETLTRTKSHSCLLVKFSNRSSMPLWACMCVCLYVSNALVFLVDWVFKSSLDNMTVAFTYCVCFHCVPPKTSCRWPLYYWQCALIFYCFPLLSAFLWFSWSSYSRNTAFSIKGLFCISASLRSYNLFHIFW